MNINQVVSKEEKDEAFKALNNKTAKIKQNSRFFYTLRGIWEYNIRRKK